MSLITATVLAGAIMTTTSPDQKGHPEAAFSVTDWGSVDGKPVQLWTLDSGSGLRMRVTNYGTIITELHAPDRTGKPVDVVLGRPTVQDYVERTQYFGCTAGRCANRIGKGQFAIDGKAFQVTCNNGPNCLHGGAKGFDKVVWEGKATLDQGMPKVVFTYTSKDGEEGFPGTVQATVTYTLTPLNQLLVDMSATTDAPTVVNMAHHSYWNLAGHASGTVLDHELQLMAGSYTPVDAALITTGEIKPVDGTPLDFRVAKPIGRDIGQLPATKDDPGGFDHNWCVDGASGTMRPAALLRSPSTGISMLVSSTQPGIQFYSGNFLDGIPGKDGATYRKHDGLCLETQAYPDSINKQGKAGWPNVVLRPGQRYDHRMVHRFSAE
ncbi:MAG: aldose epimerase family protein [Bacteroidia bacterium]|nr:aldose epimerase family protein [Bacteroidia bacterium]